MKRSSPSVPSESSVVQQVSPALGFHWRRLLLPFVLVFLAFGSVGATGKKSPGQQCTQTCQGSNGPCSDDCASGICKRWINAKYCTAGLSKCAKSGTSGVAPGATHNHQGTDYECKASVDNWGAQWVLSNGEQCDHDGQCAGKCRKAITKSFCVANDKECGWGGSDGVERHETRTQSGVKYWCDGAQMVKAKNLGETCQSWNLGRAAEGFQCASGNCASAANGTDRCTVAGKDCYTGVGSGGVNAGETFAVAGDHLFLCQSHQAGFREVARHGKLCKKDQDCLSARCREVQTSAGDEIIKNSGVCLNDDPTHKCPWYGTGGRPVGDSTTIWGKDFRCGPTGKWHELKPNGVSCSSDSDCSGFRCSPDISGQKLCRQASLACSYPGSDGKAADTVVTEGGKEYRCFQDKGWRLRDGETCQLDNECASSSCRSGPPGTSGKFCKNPSKQCGWPGISGLKTNATRQLNNKTYRCNANGNYTQVP